MATTAAASAPATTATAAQGPTAQCAFVATPAMPAPASRAVGIPPATVPLRGTVTLVLHTTVGDLPLTLPRATAPCTVASVEFLARKGFYDNSPCHRLTAFPAPNPLYVLQCGDPTGLGSGGPGYGVPDEKPTDLAPAPPGAQQPAGQYVIYPAGTVALANSGQPGSGGSQFFLVYADTHLSPDYAVFGTVSPAGMRVLATIAAGGIIPGQDPSTGQPSPQDGRPKLPVTIQRATATATG